MNKAQLLRIIMLACVLLLGMVPARASTYRHYRFNTLTENGTATPDASPNQVHVRLAGQELCDGVVGKALRFKAGNKGVALGDLGLRAPATLCFWLKTDGSQADPRILSQLEGPTTRAGCLRLTGGNLQIWSGTTWATVVNGLSDKGHWQHVALVFEEAGTVTGYRNGRKIKTARSACDFKGVKAGIGAPFLGQWGTPYVGTLDDFRIYDRALEDKEINAMYPPELFEEAQAVEVPVSEPFDWRQMMTIAPRKRDAEGKLLPLQSYDETIRRGMSFILDDHLKWFKATDTLLDEDGAVQMPWVYYSNVQHNGVPFPRSVDRFVSYPAFHHALMIRTLIGYWGYAGDDRALKEAVKLADWDIAHSTPGDWAYGNDRYQANRDLTWNWLLNGPIKTQEFRGFYEDIVASPEGRTNYDCLDTIRYLLANRTDDNGYLELARELNAWVEKIFMDKIKGFEPAEGIREQLQCNVVMGIHSLNWASMLHDLAKATGDDKMRQRAIQTANYITYDLQPDNRIVVGFQYHQWWYSCHTGVVLYLLDFVEE